MPCEDPKRVMNARYRGMTAHQLLEYSNNRFGCDWPPDLYLDVPCGHCYGCERRRLNGYRLRLLYELAKHPNSIFITLTFDNARLAHFKDDYNRAVRLFLDRARKYFGKQLRHWFTCEFGSLHDRPHYHGLLIDVPPLEYQELADLWQYGFIYIGYANEKTAHYICKYVTKSMSNGRTPPRIMTSRGIGLSYLSEDNIRIHKDVENGVYRPYLAVSDKIVPLPRYYTEKIFDDEDKLWMLVERLGKPFERHVGNDVYYNEQDYLRALRRLFLDHLQQGLTHLHYHEAKPLNTKKIKPKKLSTTYGKY